MWGGQTRGPSRDSAGEGRAVRSSQSQSTGQEILNFFEGNGKKQREAAALRPVGLDHGWWWCCFLEVEWGWSLFQRRCCAPTPYIVRNYHVHPYVHDDARTIAGLTTLVDYSDGHGRSTGTECSTSFTERETRVVAVDFDQCGRVVGLRGRHVERQRAHKDACHGR